MRVLLDTNIVLDALLEREPFFEDAVALMEAIDSEQMVGYVTATTLTNIFYIVRRQTRSIERARQAVSETLTAMQVCSVDRDILESAFASNLQDARRCCPVSLRDRRESGCHYHPQSSRFCWCCFADFVS